MIYLIIIHFHLLTQVDFSRLFVSFSFISSSHYYCCWKGSAWKLSDLTGDWRYHLCPKYVHDTILSLLLLVPFNPWTNTSIKQRGRFLNKYWLEFGCIICSVSHRSFGDTLQEFSHVHLLFGLTLTKSLFCANAKETLLFASCSPFALRIMKLTSYPNNPIIFCHRLQHNLL